MSAAPPAGGVAPPLAPPPDVRRAIEVAIETAWPRTKDALAEPTSGWSRAPRRSWRFADRPSAEPEHPGVERPG
ncbi:MAG: hypothetical protein ABSA08_01555 [Acidimicrobiales bacterium]